MIVPLAPTLLPQGAGAHCDAPAFPEPEIFATIAYRYYGTIATGGCKSGGSRAPGSVIITTRGFPMNIKTRRVNNS
jgi:hypothetical protein